MQCEIPAIEASIEASKNNEGLEPNLGGEDLLSEIPLETAKGKRDRIVDSMDSFLLPAISNSNIDKLDQRDNSDGNEKGDKGNRRKESWKDFGHASVNPDIKDCNRSLVTAGYSLPVVKIDTFSGDCTEFPAWEIAFDALIDQQVNSIELKLNLLSQHLSGEAKSLVRGLLSTQTRQAYEAERVRLKDRYGNPSVLNQAFLDKITEWPLIKSNQPKELQRFSDFLTQILEIRKASPESLKILDFPSENMKILSKLPTHFEIDWRDIVYSHRENNGTCSYPPFDRFVAFVERKSKKANIPELQMGLIQKQLPASANKFHGSQSAHYRREIRNPKVFATNINRSIVETCSYCQQEHRTNECKSFLTLGRDDALKFLTENKLCFGCADSAEHIARNCRSRSECAKCSKRHLTALHVEKENPTTEGNASARCTEVCANGIDNSMILPVRIRSNRSPKEIVCYCIIDEQSNACFMSDELRELLECPGVDTNLTISTVLKSNAVISCKRVDNLEVLSFNKDECVKLPPVYTRECIPASDSQIPRPEVPRKWPHLEPISDEIFPFQPKAKVSLLIGIRQ